MPSDYSLPDVLERLYENQQALEAAIMELTLLVEEQGAREVGGNVRGALWTMAENAGHIKQGLARIEKIGHWLTDCIPKAVDSHVEIILWIFWPRSAFAPWDCRFCFNLSTGNAWRLSTGDCGSRPARSSSRCAVRSNSCCNNLWPRASPWMKNTSLACNWRWAWYGLRLSCGSWLRMWEASSCDRM